MAARIDRIHSERVRARIKLSLLTKRLQDSVLAGSELNSDQIRAATFLIGKAMGDPPTVVAGPGDEGQHKLDITLTFK